MSTLAQTLAELLGIQNVTKFGGYIHRGGLAWAKEVLRSRGITLLKDQVAEATRQRDAASPAPGVSGASKHFNNDGRRKYHWPQVGWDDLLKVHGTHMLALLHTGRSLY